MLRVNGQRVKTWQTLAFGILMGCTHRDPPAPLPEPSAPAAFAKTTAAAPSPSVVATVARAGGTANAATSAIEAPDALPPSADGEEQTKDMPSAESAAFRARIHALFKAIQTNDVSMAKSSFFPVGAYEKVKAVANARGDHERRLMAAFARDIAALHKKHGDKWSDAKLLGVDVPMERARWIMPGEEGNKLGYFRAYHSHISYEIDGTTHRAEIVSLISWRGDWYIVHLSGFK